LWNEREAAYLKLGFILLEESRLIPEKEEICVQ
jgi:hypothetical protein